MELIFLGTGASIGLPLIAFEHTGVDLRDARNWRTRPSIHVVMDGHHIQVDAAQEFRLQCLHNKIEQLDTFILTHEHSDHVLGMEDLRRFCTLRGAEALPIYGAPVGLKRVREVFPYAIADKPKHGGYAAFSLREIGSGLEGPWGRIDITPLPHPPTETLGLIFTEASTGKKLAFYTDCNAVPPAACELAKGCDVVVLDALYYKKHRSHMSIAEAVEVAQDIAAAQTYLTHLTYPIDHATLAAELPSTIAPAYDGLRVEI